MLTAVVVLAATAFAAGVTGAWSPCGFSIVDTLSRARRRSTLAAACVALTVGTVAGGVATFATLSAAGALAPEAARALVVPAAVLALLAAIAEARGVRIVPQVRRQVPEPWRRMLPLPLAAGAYGVLLGLGFATFVLTLAFWVLVAVAFALGDVRVGLVVGLAFGLGRALPVVALAPLARRPAGLALTDAMAMRPAILRGFRLANAAGLIACAAALGGTGAGAATVVARGAVDPSAAAEAIAWEERGRGVLFLRAPREPAGAHHLGPLAAPLPGSDPAVGGELLAWREGALVHVVRIADLTPVAELRIPGVDALAVDDAWLAYRARRRGVDVIGVLRVAGGEERLIATAGTRGALGRPALAGDRVAFHAATPRVSRIVVVDLPEGRARTVRSSRTAQLTHPSLRGQSLLYVRQSALTQTLRLGPLEDERRDRVLHRSGPVALRDPGYQPGYSRVTRTPRPRRARDQFWSTALSPDAALLTLVPVDGSASRARIVRIAR